MAWILLYCCPFFRSNNRELAPTGNNFEQRHRNAEATHMGA